MTGLRPKGKATHLSEQIAEKLFQFRRENKIGQREVADTLLVSTQQYQKYENGRDRLSLEKAILFCKAYKLSLQFFMIGEDNA